MWPCRTSAKDSPYYNLYVKNFNVVDDEDDLLVDDRPRNVLRTAAIITERAYVAGGVEVSIDNFDKFTLACLEAKLTGIPKAYVLKTMADFELQNLLATMLDAAELQDGAEEYGGYEQFVAIGAGITRHFLQHELAA